MGLIRMGVESVASSARDQIRELFECGQMADGVLMQPATLVVRGKAKNKGTKDVITNGSVFNVARNQCALLVENGKVHDLIVGTEETEGQYRYDTSLEPSLLTGGMGELNNVMVNVKNRFTMGGQSQNIMRLCYINLLEMRNNKIGIGNVPFRDSEFGFTVKVQGFGNYSFKVTNPVIFFENVCNDPGKVFHKNELLSQMKSEMGAAIQPALGRIAASGISYDQLINYPKKIGEEINDELSREWHDLRGIECVSLALESITVDDESAKKISLFQESRAFGSNPAMAGGRLVGAQATAMESAAQNSAGAMTGFMGMGMAMNQGGIDGASLIQQGQQQQQQPQQAGAEKPQGAVWKCACGKENTGNFCSECGAKKPDMPEEKFCPECGTKAEPDAKFCKNCGNKLV